MVPVAGFADVLTMPFTEMSVEMTDGDFLLRESFSAVSPFTTEKSPAFDWELNSVSCHGTFFTVTQARPLGRDGQFLYAVKRLKPKWQYSSVGRVILNREAELGQLISHPHVVPTLDENTDCDEPYIVQPWLQGKTLQESLSLGRTAKPSEVIWIARQIAEALAELEKHGYCHCDVKPGNMIVSPNGHATLIDLGLARRMEEPLLPIDRAVVGTPKYMAPELTDRSFPGDIRADLYSLGLVMLEMLFGQAILPANSMSQLYANQWQNHWGSLASQTNRHWQSLADLESLLRSMTDPDVTKRPDSAGMITRQLVSMELAAM